MVIALRNASNVSATVLSNSANLMVITATVSISSHLMIYDSEPTIRLAYSARILRAVGLSM